MQWAEDTVAKWAGTSSGSGSSTSPSFGNINWSALGAQATSQALSLMGAVGGARDAASRLLLSHFQANVSGLPSSPRRRPPTSTCGRT